LILETLASTEGNHMKPRKEQVEPILFGVEEAATFLGLSSHTIRKMADRGELSKVKIGSRTMFSPDELRAFVARAFARMRNDS
jgi:excisionase family DNA binding protein